MAVQGAAGGWECLRWVWQGYLAIPTSPRFPPELARHTFRTRKKLRSDNTVLETKQGSKVKGSKPRESLHCEHQQAVNYPCQLPGNYCLSTERWELGNTCKHFCTGNSSCSSTQNSSQDSHSPRAWRAQDVVGTTGSSHLPETRKAHSSTGAG